MNLVLDVSAALALITDRPLKRMREVLRNADAVYAPTLYDYELTNVTWKYVKANIWSAGDAAAVLDDAMELVDERADGAALTTAALSLAGEHSHPAYDFFYILVALQRDATLLTCDRRMRTLAEAMRVSVITD